MSSATGTIILFAIVISVDVSVALVTKMNIVNVLDALELIINAKKFNTHVTTYPRYIWTNLARLLF